MKSPLFTVLILFASIMSQAQVLKIHIGQGHFGIDHDKRIVVAHLQPHQQPYNLSRYTQIQLYLNTLHYEFTTKPHHFDFTSEYQIRGNGKVYALFFTQIPLISIHCKDSIVNEPKRLAYFTFADTSETVQVKTGIELRGGVSLGFPKKTYDLEFWKDNEGHDSKKIALLELRKDDDWILDGLYNEPLRLRSFFANKLWLKMHQPYYAQLEVEAKSGADVSFVELFLNNAYKGIYNLSEQVDKKQLKLKSFESNKIRGELYKGSEWGGATLYKNVPVVDNTLRTWGGYDYKYPDKDEVTDWSNLEDFKLFVTQSTNEHFEQTLWQRFDYSNFIDYFIFINLLRAEDNTGKNVYLARYSDQEPYFFVPWDLDLVIGSTWQKQHVPNTEGLITNLFFNRVMALNVNGFKDSLHHTWQRYRSNILHNDSVLDLFNFGYQYLKSNNAFQREALIYPEEEFNEESLQFVNHWLLKRLKYLDGAFDPTTSSISTPLSHHKGLNLYPNPADKILHLQNISYSKPSFYSIRNSLGQQVQVGWTAFNKILIQNLDSGIYFLECENKRIRFIKAQ